MAMSDNKTQSVYAPLTSRIDNVKVYAAGATITRVADLQLDRGNVPEHVEIAGLPLALDDGSVRVRIEAEQDTAAIATDIRIGLAVPPRQEVKNAPTDEEVREAKAEVQRIEDAIALIDNEISVLYQLQVPKRPEGEKGKAPPPSPLSARLALANFSDEQVRARIQERRENLEKLRIAREHLEELLLKQARASTAREVRSNELRKTVVIRLSYEGEPSTIVGQRLVVEYFVPGARWTPTYVCRLDSARNQAALAVRALICQRTGEDWSGVRLELSTAEPLAWCELPELPSLRLGRAQPVHRKSGWRRPPIGAEILFENFDRHKEGALATVHQHSIFTNISFLSVPPLPNLSSKSPKEELLSVKREVEREIGASVAVEIFSSIQEMSQEPAANEYPDDEDPTSQIPIEELQLSVRAYNCLKRAQINSVADLLDYSQEDLLEIKNFRQESVEEVIEALQRRLGITLPSGEGKQELPRVIFAEAVSAPQAPQPRRPVFAKAVSAPQAPQPQPQKRRRMDEDYSTDRLAYSLMQMGTADDAAKRGKLSIEQQHEAYLELLKRWNVVVTFDVMEVVQQAVVNAQNCLSVKLPPGGINVREVAGSFDYAYSADGRVDVPSDGEFHSVALTSNSTGVNLRYVVVPREDTNVFRIAQLKNPLQAPLLAGSADVYVDGEYILSTNITTVPPKGQMELGLGVEQAIKVARNTTYQEARSGDTLVAFNELRHQIQIDIANRLPREARIEVRERLPIPDENAKVDVQIDSVSPEWEKYEQKERDVPIRSGYRWWVQVPPGEKKTLSVNYTIKTFVDSELMGGNRRE
jgi:hypothetical protein